MRDTGWTVPLEKQPRVVSLHQKTNGKLVETANPATLTVPVRGDGRLFSTAADYARFVQMMLGEGRWGSQRLLKKDTVRTMGRNQTGRVKVQLQPSADTAHSKPYPAGAGEDVWGLGFQVAQPAKPRPDARRPGSLSWAGINNTFFWIDPQAGIGCVVLMQLLPFYDGAALDVLRGVVARVYRHLLPRGPQERSAGA
jgi:CubicO group peptidase (beta-lactamase class C family)